jgi:PIN domain nuclease of toxin-antitoxin system
MIILDTHIWVWHVQGDRRLTTDYAAVIGQHESTGLGVNVISLWEIAKAVERGKLSIPVPVDDWLTLALSYPVIKLLPPLPRIAVESTRLPGIFHKDPADQIIVVAARIYNCPLVTFDKKILSYPHVKLLP